ncbi:hypothetical protein ACQZV8_04245 [Magnetococcales bacterium HHB-1]
MTGFLGWVDGLDWGTLLVIAILLGLAPFHPEPHLVEKLRMLFHGKLVRPLDIFDLFMHATPILIVILKGVRQWLLK